MKELSQVAKELADLIGRERVHTDRDTIARYGVDGVPAKAVALPKDTRQMADVIGWAARHGLSILPWGSGTKMSQGLRPGDLDLVVCTARMNRMLDVDTANLTITLEAGVKFRDVQARLATEDNRCYLPLEGLAADAGEVICSERSHSGCFLPLDPPFSARATLGGIIASNSTGPRSLLYGLPRDLVLGVRFVTPGGDIVGAGGKTVKNVSGYDISKLMVGSFGSLGVLCEMTLRLLPLPEAMETLLLSFDSLAAAQSFARAVLETRLLPAALELGNAAVFRNIPFRGVSGTFDPLGYVVMVALEAFQEAVERMRREMIVVGERFGAQARAVLRDDDHRLFWLAVSDLQASLADRFPNLVSVRLFYPLGEWKGILESMEQILSRNEGQGGFLCHVGTGVCVAHLFHEQGREHAGAAGGVVRELLAACRKAGGNLNVLRAPVGMKRDLPVWGEPGSDLVVMKRVKQRIDPQGLMSPGRFVV